jgi:hypothetical protein
LISEIRAELLPGFFRFSILSFISSAGRQRNVPIGRGALRCASRGGFFSELVRGNRRRAGLNGSQTRVTAVHSPRRSYGELSRKISRTRTAHLRIQRASKTSGGSVRESPSRRSEASLSLSLSLSRAQFRGSNAPTTSTADTATLELTFGRR